MDYMINLDTKIELSDYLAYDFVAVNYKHKDIPNSLIVQAMVFE